MSSAADRLTSVIDYLSQFPDGVTVSELATHLRTTNQAARRILESMAATSMVGRDAAARRYYLRLSFYHWGFSAAKRYAPPPLVQQEMAALAAKIHQSVYLLLRDRNWIVGMERVAWEGNDCFTAPFLRRYHWSESIIGLAVVAALPTQERDELLANETVSKDAIDELRAELDVIAQRGFAERNEKSSSYLAAAPVFYDEQGPAAIVLTAPSQPSADDRAFWTSSLVDCTARCSTTRRVANVLDLLD